MVVVNTQGQEINAKVVYYGPALSGKTTNLEQIYEQMPSDAKGKMVSMKTRTDRTLFFDFLPLELGDINGYRTRMLLYTVPGQVYYNATRKLVLKGADAVVFVADSAPSKLAENIESLRNLEENLNELGMTLDTIPWVIQYNKRDLADAAPVRTLESELNLLGVPSFEAVATQGVGVYETFQGIAGVLFAQLAARLVATGQPPARKPGEEAVGVRVPAPEARKPETAVQSPTPVTAGVTPAGANAARGFDSTVARVVESGLREVAEPPASPRAGRNAPSGDTPAARPAPAERPPQAGAVPTPAAQGGADSAFRFASLEAAAIDESVGRVLDLEPDSRGKEPPDDNGRGERDFITDPCRATAADVSEEVSRAVPAAGGVTLTERSTPVEDECVITVPVLLSRSQTRKTIPIKLRLEVQIVNDEP